MDRKLSKAEQDKKIFNTFRSFKKGPNVPRDGNCGLYAICNALHDVLDVRPETTMRKIFKMFGLHALPNYWWSDEELAVILSYFKCEAFIVDERRAVGTVFKSGRKFKTVLLYNVNDNSHWRPGIKTKVPSTNIPKSYAIINNIMEVLSIAQIKLNIYFHLQKQFMNPNEALVEYYSSGLYTDSRNRQLEAGEEKRNHEDTLEQFSPLINRNISRSADVVKQCVKLKNVVLSKTVKLLAVRLKRKKKKKYKQFDSSDSEEEGGDFENRNDSEFGDVGFRYTTEWDTFPMMANTSYSPNGAVIFCLCLNDNYLTGSADCQPRSFESPHIRSIEYPLLEPVADNNLQMSTNPYMTSNSTSAVCSCLTCSFTYTCNVDDCPLSATEYKYDDQCCEKGYVSDLVNNNNTARRKKNKVVRLFNRICTRTTGMTKYILTRCFVKLEPTVSVSVVDVPTMVSSVVAFPEVAASVDNDQVVKPNSVADDISRSNKTGSRQCRRLKTPLSKRP